MKHNNNNNKCTCQGNALGDGNQRHPKMASRRSLCTFFPLRGVDSRRKMIVKLNGGGSYDNASFSWLYKSSSIVHLNHSILFLDDLPWFDAIIHLRIVVDIPVPGEILVAMATCNTDNIERLLFLERERFFFFSNL